MLLLKWDDGVYWMYYEIILLFCHVFIKKKENSYYRHLKEMAHGADTFINATSSLGKKESTERQTGRLLVLIFSWDLFMNV